MKNVEIILFLYRDMIFGKVLHVHSDLIGGLDRQFIIKNYYYYIRSNMNPALQDLWGSNILWTWGCDKENNNIVMVLNYGNKEIALRVFKGFCKCVKELNKT